MNTKEKVLQMLTEAPGGLSGEILARRLGLSRTSVWKAIRSLKAEGCAIEGVTNRGYRLIRGVDTLDAAVISGGRKAPAEVFETLPSTNIVARERACCGAPHGTVIIANTQSSGRGRRGRSFVSGGLGIYMSVVIRPDDPSDATLVTTAAAVAVRDAIEEVCGKACGIKWVNDLYYEGKKVVGILTEAVTDMESGYISGMVVGIGINFRGTPEDFPPELRSKAGFLLCPGEAPDGPDRSALASRVAANLLERVASMGDRRFLEDYRRHSIILGRRVEYLRGGRTVVATALEIDDNGALRVLRDDGDYETISAGEVSVRRADLGGIS